MTQTVCRLNCTSKAYNNVFLGLKKFSVEKIETLRKIDVVDYDTVRNQYLKEDIERYGKQIY